MRKNLGFRAWFYFRQGWSTYFAFILAAINVMVTTYYLAIKDVPILKAIFPSFGHYVIIMTIIAIPILVVVGYVHYKKSGAYSAEADINVESYPYWYKLPPGWNAEVLFPLYLTMINLLVKLSKNEKLTEEENQKISELQKSLDTLINGGHVGNPKRKPTKTN
jgi:hypothetical protein